MIAPDHIISKHNTSVPGVIVICGPTATGKSGLAIALAQRLQSVILSADSRQVYREFNIGTAKPSPEEQKIVPHYLIDICDPRDTLTVADYQEQAQQLIRQFHQADPQPGPREIPSPLLVGGTGLYIKSIVRGLKIPRVPPHPELRTQLQSLGQPQLYAMLTQVDPEAVKRIHANDQVRTLRALEVFYITGYPISQQQGETVPDYPILHIGLTCTETAALDRRIAYRTGLMLEMGFEAEVRALLTKYGPELPLLDTLGYQEMKQYLLGDRSLAEAKAAIVLHTRQFAKRQRTWFGAIPEIEWFDADRPDLLEQVWQRVMAWGKGYARR